MQTKERTFQFDQIMISSQFQSGNLAKAIQKDQLTFQLWIQPDPNSTYKTWFYFSIQHVPIAATVTFIIKNMSNQLKLFKQGLLPVFCLESEKNWQKIKIPIQQNGIIKSNQGYELTFRHNFIKKQKHFFAFSYPFSNTESDILINNFLTLNKQNIYASYTILGESTQKRPLKLLTITSLLKQINKWKQLSVGQIQSKVLVCQTKKGIFISARVHPGQVASSHILNGFLQFLFSNGPQAQDLLKHFIFYIIPIINPDGVAMGNFRTDSNGKNLNRFYTSPNKQTQPQIYRIKQFLLSMIQGKYIQFCLDLHAHVNKQGAFIYGNSIQNLKGQVQVCLFPKILAYNSEYFDYDACNFSQKNMSSKDKTDDLSKEGASRVAIYKQTGLKACWTLQCNYNSAKCKNQLLKLQPQVLKTVSNGVLTQKTYPNKKQQQVFYTLTQFKSIGRSIAESILDYYGLRESARYYVGKLKNRQNFELNLSIQILRMIPFRFDNECRKILTNLNGNINISDSLSKISKLIRKNQFKIGQSKFIKIESVKNQIYKKSQSKNKQQIYCKSTKQIYEQKQGVKIDKIICTNLLQSGLNKTKQIKLRSMKQIQKKVVITKQNNFKYLSKRFSVKITNLASQKVQQKC